MIKTYTKADAVAKHAVRAKEVENFIVDVYYEVGTDDDGGDGLCRCNRRLVVDVSCSIGAVAHADAEAGSMRVTFVSKT